MLTEEDVSTIDQSLNDATPQLLEAIAKDISTIIETRLPLEVAKILINFLLRQGYSLIKDFSSKSISQKMTMTDLNFNSPVDIAPHESAQLILEDIKKLRDDVVYDCEKEFKKQLNYPNEQAYTKFNKFYKLAFSERISQRRWRDFYDSKKSILWPDAQQKQEYERVEREWQNLVNSAVDALTSIN